MDDYEYLSYKSRYLQNEYDFDLDLIKDENDFLSFIAQGNKTFGDVSNGAVLLITEDEYIFSYNRGMGQGPHDLTFARICSMMQDKKIDYSNARSYCKKLENLFLHARLFSERESRNSKQKNIISFSFNRDSISEKEYERFIEFCNTYEFILKKYDFDVSFKGKTMSLDSLKERLKSMINYDLVVDYEGLDTSKITMSNTKSSNNDKKL